MVDVGRDVTRRGARDGGRTRPDAAREAQSRIEREAARRTGRLSLAGLGLTLLPPGLLELSRLRELDLSHNRIEQLPEGVSRLADLERLLLRGNRLAALPPSLTALTRLKHLDLAENQFAEIPRWLGRLDLESIELGDAADLVHPPAGVAAQGTAAVLAYLRERDGRAGAQLDGARRAKSASADTPATASDTPTSTPPDAATDTATQPARSVWWRTRYRTKALSFGAGALILLAAAAFVLPRVGSAPPARTSGAPAVQDGPGGATSGAVLPNAALSLPAMHASAAISAARASAPMTSAGASQNATAPVADSQSATAPLSFLPAPLASMPAAPLVAPILSADLGGALCLGSATGHGANAGQPDVIICDTAPPAWTFEPDGDTLQISGLCMTVGDDGQSAGARVVLDPCDASAGQVFVPQSGGYLYNPGSGLCVSEATTSKKHQQTVVLMELCGAAGQQWNMPAA